MKLPFTVRFCVVVLPLPSTWNFEAVPALRRVVERVLKFPVPPVKPPLE